jgi:malate dehydrogenase (oxaloacetate-decarboxylating)(NADP+)
MFIVAARAVADQVTKQQLEEGMLYPPQANLLDVELNAAGKIAEVIFAKGLARVDKPADVNAFIRAHAYDPKYPSFTESR